MGKAFAFLYIMGKSKKSKSEKSELKSIRIRTLNKILMVLSCILCLGAFLATVRTKFCSWDLADTMNDYAECNKAVNSFREASDYLTDQVRLFAINLDPVNMNLYFDELENVQRRDRAIEILEMTHENDEPDEYLKKAFEASRNLEKAEYYSFRMVCEGLDYSEDDMPLQIRNVVLPEEIENMSDQRKIVEARSYLFESEYMTEKSQVLNYIAKTLTSLIDDYLVKESESEKKLSDSITFQHIIIILLLAVSATLFILLIILVLNPISSFVKAIEKGSKINLKGSYELRYIQNSYNQLIEKNENRASILKYKAEHDPLTGLINREAFVDIKEALSKFDEPVAYLIIDIDYFKKINDTYGHATGDMVLKKTAEDLLIQFRSTDYVARIGGDEFAVIMTKFGEDPESVIERKIKTLNETLQKEGLDSNNLPPVSLSVGVSISYTGFNKKMETEADEAMYRVKKGGRCNCSFYKA